MASIPVNNNLNMLMNTVNPTAQAAGGKDALFAKAQEVVKQSFDSVMDRVSMQAVSQLDTSAMVGEITSPGTAVDSAVKDRAAGNAASDAKQPVETRGDDAAEQVQEKDVTTETPDEQKEAVTETADKVVKEVAKELDVSEEDVKAAMEVLGLTVADLLDPENLKMLLVTLSGGEDAMVLLTDSDLYQSLQNLLDMVSDVKEELQAELGISEDELDALLKEVSTDLKQAAETEAEEIMNADAQVKEPVLEGMQDYTVTVQRDGETVEIKVSVDDTNGDKSAKEEVITVPKEVHAPEDKSGMRNAGEQKGEGNAAGNNTAGSFIMQSPILEPLAPETVQQAAPEPFVSTQDIMNQIMEYMKIDVKEGVQELEMQLHPASLGSVNVRIAAVDGFITAQFHAQNEVVRAAIESQLIILKDQFEEQGIKVDAVEVTVGNYQTRQSFSEQEENAQESKEKGKKQRRINLSALDGEELPEDMDDSERIAVEMMERSGNTVDFTA